MNRRDEPPCPRYRTLLGALGFSTLPGATFPRLCSLFLEASGLGVIALWLTQGWPARHAGILAVFLTAAGLLDRIHQLLDENREAHFVHQTSPGLANRRTAASLAALFLGVLATFAAWTVWQGEPSAWERFDFVLGSAELGASDIFDRRFGSWAAIVVDNLRAMLSIFLVTFLYQAFGAALVLTWNACMWAVVLAVLTLRASTLHPEGVVASGWAALAVVPHLVLEAVAYCLVALAAIFLSRSVLRYRIREPIMQDILRSSGVLLGVALLLVLAAAYLEQILG